MDVEIDPGVPFLTIESIPGVSAEGLFHEGPITQMAMLGLTVVIDGEQYVIPLVAMDQFRAREANRRNQGA